jgi:SAM-dependent methyltransferase
MPSEQAALRGEPSYVWRSGQERRLKMVERLIHLQGKTILEFGCGNGIYASQFQRRYAAHVEAFDIETQRVAEAQVETPHALVAVGEALPYRANSFDLVFSNEVIEHVRDDQVAASEMVRVTKPGGHVLLFCPNRWYPFETHGHYWRGTYHFGNTPLINYLPDPLRNQLAPHVRAYTAKGIQALFTGLPVRVVHHSRIFGGYDNIARRLPGLGRVIRDVLYGLESTPFRFFGLSHLLVMQKLS